MPALPRADDDPVAGAPPFGTIRIDAVPPFLRHLRKATVVPVCAFAAGARRLGKLRHFPPVDVAQLVVLAALLVVIEVALRTQRLDTVARRSGMQFLPVDGAPNPQMGTDTRIALSPAERRWVNNVGRVVRRWPWDASCLRRSLLLGWVLRRRHPVLVVGVRVTGLVEAHAWVRVEGVDLDPAAASYVAFVDRGAG